MSNKKQTQAQLEKAYFAEAASWDQDKKSRLVRSEKRAWRWASVVLGVAALEAVALMSLAPLKTVEPFVIRVDNNNGFVDVISTLTETDGEIQENAQEVMDKYWLGQYIRHREGYLWETRNYDRQLVGLMSNGAIQESYAQYTDPELNPQAPVTVFGSNVEVRTKVTGISILNSEKVEGETHTTALVRYTKTQHQTGTRDVVTHWSATITFRYLSSSIKIDDRQLNPLGFQVITYRNDQESVGN